MNNTKLAATLDYAATVEELRAAYWHLINVRDTMRHHANPYLNMSSFRINEASEIVAAVLLRHLEEEEVN